MVRLPLCVRISSNFPSIFSENLPDARRLQTPRVFLDEEEDWGPFCFGLSGSTNRSASTLNFYPANQLHYTLIIEFKNIESVSATDYLLNSGISNLWFGKPMVCLWVAFPENDENHENDEDNSDSYKRGVQCWIHGNHGNHRHDENHENPGCKPRVPQTRGLEIPELCIATCL